MRWLARAMVCSPDEQKRFTVMPGTVIGQPARMAIWRAMFQPVAPSGLAQPMITSSTSSASTFASSSAACTTWPPIFAPWVMLSAPRQLLQSGVRAVETMTASAIEPPALFRQFHEQRRRIPRLPLIAFLETFDRIQHLVQTDGVRIEHRSAPIGREAVAGEVDHVDVGGAQGDAFLEDVRAFVDQRVDQARDDFVVADLSRGYFYFFSVLRNDFVNRRVGNGLAVSGFVLVEALAGLLPEAALLADAVGEARVDEVRALLVAALANFPADVV